MKKIILLFMLLLLTGCKDYTEINDLGIISGMIIDYKDNKYEITTEIITNDKESELQILSTTSTSIDEAIKELSKLTNKKVFIPHLKVLIITDNILKEDIDYYDYFLRNSKSSMNFYVYYIDSKIKDKIFKINDESDKNSLHIEKMLEFNKQIFSSTTPLTFIDLVYKKLEPGIDIIYPVIEIKNNNDKDILYLSNQISYKNDKLITFTEDESITYNILANTIDKSSITIDCDNESFTLQIQDIKTKYKWKKDLFNINSHINAKITDYECKYDLNDIDSLKKLEKLSINHISNEINNLIDKIKKDNNDVLGIENYIYKHDRNYNKNNFKLNNIKNKNNIEFNIISTGEIRK